MCETKKISITSRKTAFKICLCIITKIRYKKRGILKIKKLTFRKIFEQIPQILKDFLANKASLFIDIPLKVMKRLGSCKLADIEHEF